jgi:hypothetical protein
VTQTQVIFYGMSAPHVRKDSLMRFSKNKRWIVLGEWVIWTAGILNLTNRPLDYGKLLGAIDVVKSLNLNRKAIFLTAQLQKNVGIKILNAKNNIIRTNINLTALKVTFQEK